MSGLNSGSLQIGDGESSSRRNIWFGHEFVDQETMQHVRGVVLAATIMAALQVLSLLVALTTGSHFTGAIVNFMLNMILPACGYFGATRSSSEMMCLRGVLSVDRAI
eukprot:symbB.v1.2.011876.t1/scaffold806.1/size231046/3